MKSPKDIGDPKGRFREAKSMNRGRRLRAGETMRGLVRETALRREELIAPLYVVEGEGIKREISALPGQYYFSVDRLSAEIDELSGLRIKSVLLFGVPMQKDEQGSAAYEEGNLIARAIGEIKRHNDSILVAADVCLCEYTSHGHCGIVENGCVDNDKTLPLLAKAAISYAAAGADIIAPSDMMDGRVGYIRQKMDESGFENTAIMAYSAKYASAFYEPFRVAVDSTPQFGDRKGYQMDIANRREAVKEALYDIEEGADIVMVKPALSYLDVIYEVRNQTNCPVAAYNVSGEYVMVKAAEKAGLLNGPRAAMEILTSIKRAGADIIITHFAKELAEGGWLN